MALWMTDVATGQSSDNARDRIEGQRVTGELEFAEAIYTTVGTEIASDTIQVVTLPVGAMVWPEKSHVACEALGGTGTAIAKLGDAGDDDRYSATSIALTSAAVIAVTPAVATSVTSRYAMTSTTNVVQATLALSSGSITAGKKVVFLIAFRMP